MDINKAIRKQKKSIKRFWLAMGFIFSFLPTVVVLNKTFSFFIMLYLCIIEFLIILALLIHTHKNTLNFNYCKRLKIQNGIWRGKYSIDCDKIAFVHAFGEEDFKIIIILKSKIRNKNLKVLNPQFFRKYVSSKGCYKQFHTDNIEKKYYYVVINRGGYKKYQLIDTMYRYCVKAYFTDEAIQKIKEYRNKE